MTTDHKVILFRAPEVDGLFACLSAFKRLGWRALYLPIREGSRVDPILVHIKPDDQVIFLGTTGPAGLLDKVVNKVLSKGSVVVIDHRAESIEAVTSHLTIADYVDPERATSTLAWGYFHPTAKLPRAFELIEDAVMKHSRIQGSDAFMVGLLIMNLDKIVVTREFFEGLEFLDIETVQLKGLEAEAKDALAIATLMQRAVKTRLGSFELMTLEPATLDPRLIDPLGRELAMHARSCGMDPVGLIYHGGKGYLRSLSTFDCLSMFNFARGTKTACEFTCR